MRQRPLLLINHRSPERNSGKATGISHYLLSLTRGLLERGNFEIGLVTSWKQNDIPQDLLDRLAFVRRKRLIYPRVADVFWQSVTMPWIDRAYRADMVLSIDPIGAPTGGKARMFVVHDLYFKTLAQRYRWRERFFNDVIHRVMLASNDAVVCVSDHTMQDLNRFYQPRHANIRRIYSGAPQPVSGGDKTSAELGHLLWVSNITANKNIECFYRALDLLSVRGKGCKAIVVGADPHGIEAAARSRLQYASPPQRLVDVRPETLARLYRDAICLVNTSLSEGFGLPILEAQAAGTPVVCPSQGAPAEIGGKDSVLTFAQHRPSELASQIVAIKQNSDLRHRLIERGSLNVKRFTWDTTAAQVEALIWQILAAKNGLQREAISESEARLENVQ